MELNSSGRLKIVRNFGERIIGQEIVSVDERACLALEIECQADTCIVLAGLFFQRLVQIPVEGLVKPLPRDDGRSCPRAARCRRGRN